MCVCVCVWGGGGGGGERESMVCGKDNEIESFIHMNGNSYCNHIASLLLMCELNSKRRSFQCNAARRYCP